MDGWMGWMVLMQYRNGLTGELLKSSGKAGAVDAGKRYRTQRVRRTRLQSALKARVPEGVIKLQKRLTSLEKLDEGGVKLVFEDGEEVLADLVVGGDGIRSVVRQHVFPDHNIRFTGSYISHPIPSHHSPLSSPRRISDLICIQARPSSAPSCPPPPSHT